MPAMISADGLRRLLRPRSALLLAALLAAAACLPTRPEGELTRVHDKDDAGSPDSGIVVGNDGGALPDGSTGPKDPHGVSNASPDHGPFKGGTRVIVQGAGFAFKPRVWFGDVEAAPQDVASISAKKVQVNAPPNVPGQVDIAVQNGDDASTRRVLEGAFTYDPFYLEPDEGPTSGGTVIKIHGSGTAWAPGTTVKIGDKDCLEPKVVSPTELTCVAPPGAAGVRSVTTLVPGGKGVTVLDAFTFSDSDNGFKGGLSGDALPDPQGGGEGGQLRVIALDSFTGGPLKGAKVLLNDGGSAATTDESGIAVIGGVFAGTSVTVARKCSQPTTFVAVPVDTVTMYLDPVIAPSCAPPEGDPPPVGGKPSAGAKVSGELVFSTNLEFKTEPWSLVPKPKTDSEKRVAYLFTASSDPKSTFKLPPASQAVTEGAPGELTYTFEFDAPVGNLAVYALAGIEDRTVSPPHFSAYAFGLVRGVSTQPGETTGDVALEIGTTLDQVITLSLDAPKPGPKGPDRVQASVAVALGNNGYAIFPGAQKTELLPLMDGQLSFVGLPPLVGPLAGFSYVSTAQAGTGPSLSLPTSVVGKYVTQSASTVVSIDEFVRVPKLDQPSGVWDDQQVDLSFSEGGVLPDLVVLDIESGGGLIGWTVAVPSGITSFRLPDLRKVPDAGLEPGAVSFTVTSASIPGFEYAKLRYRDMQPRGWSAYAQDSFFAQLPP